MACPAAKILSTSNANSIHTWMFMWPSLA